MNRVAWTNSGRRRAFFWFALCAVLSLGLLSTASARPFRLAKLPDGGKNFGCGTCHADPRGGGPRNPFGQDYERIALKAGDLYTDALAAADSDGDGAGNGAEFSAGTHPGNPASKP